MSMAVTRGGWSWQAAVIAITLTAMDTVAIPRSSAKVTANTKSIMTARAVKDNNAVVGDTRFDIPVMRVMNKTSFDWRTIDKLTIGKTLPILKRVKRSAVNEIEPISAAELEPHHISVAMHREDRVSDALQRLPTAPISHQTELLPRSHNNPSNIQKIFLSGASNISESDSGTMLIQALVSPDGLIVLIDGTKVYSSWNQAIPWGNTTAHLHAGVHMLVLCARTGNVMRAVNFMTWQMASSARLIKELSVLGHQRILVLVGVPDFYKHLSVDAVVAVTSAGSYFFERLAMQEAFFHVSVSGGGPVLFEAARTKYTGLIELLRDKPAVHIGPPLWVEIPIHRIYKDRCAGVSGLQGGHKLFCERYEGYGEFCACNATLASYAVEQKDHNSSSPVIAVALVGGIRLPQVLEQIRTILANTGGQRVPMVMCLDGGHQEAEQLASLFNVTVAINQHNKFKKGSAARVNFMIQWSVSKVFAVFPDAEFAIIVEDDLQLAPDFMPFFRQMTSMLADPRELLMCVNAYNYNAFPETAGNYSRLVRHQGTPAYGWMITRAVGKEIEEYDLWPLEYNISDWDFYLSTMVMGTRQILAPEVPRTRHMGGGGVHVTGIEQERYFKRRIFNDNLTYVRMDTESARRHAYQDAIEQGIERAHVLDLTRNHPCHPDLLLQFQANTSFVIYINMESDKDEFKAYETVMRCLGGNDRSPQEHLHMMFLLYMAGHTVYVVGCPASQYYCKYNSDSNSYYKPRQAEMSAVGKTYYKRVPMKQVTVYRALSTAVEDAFIMEDVYDHITGLGFT